MQLLLTLRNAETYGVAEAQKRVSGSLSIGRGKQAGWPLPDPTRMLSAIHCEIKQEKRGFTLTDFSRNGTRLNGEVITRMEPTSVSSGDLIEIGAYLIAVGDDDGWDNHLGEKTVISKRIAPDIRGEKTVVAGAAPFAKRTVEVETAPTAQKKHKPTAIPQQTPPIFRSGKEASRQFVEAFCDGAGLDPDSLAARSDLELARELGVVMRNLARGMHEMSQMIGELRTLIGSSEKGAADPFEDAAIAKGASQKRKHTERLLAIYFGNLRADNTSADVAFGAAIDDASRHNRALFFAMQTALFRLLNELSPTAIERDTKTGIILSKPARNWNAYLQKWESLNTGGEDGMLDVFLRYFGEAYDAKMQSL